MSQRREHNPAHRAALAAAGSRNRLRRAVSRRRRASGPYRRDQSLHRATALRGHRELRPCHHRRGYFPSRRADGMGMPCRKSSAHGLRRCARRLDASRATDPARLRNLGRRLCLGAPGAGLSAVPGAVRAQHADHHHAGIPRRPAAGHPQDRRGAGGDPPRADQCRQELQAHASAAILENPVSLGAADYFRRHPARHDLRPDQCRRRRVPDQFRRARPAHQRTRRALRSAGHLCGDLVCHSGQHRVLHRHGKSRAMAEIVNAGARGANPGSAG